MNIVYDPTPLGAYFGNSSYTTSLILALARGYPDDRFLVPSYFPSRWRPTAEDSGTQAVRFLSILPDKYWFPRPLRPAIDALGKKIQAGILFPRADLYHCTSPTFWVDGAKRSVVTMHDLIPLCGHESWSSSWDQRFYKDRLPEVIKRCDAIIAVSDATRSQLLDRFPAAEGKTTVVHSAAAPCFVKTSVDPGVLAKYGIDAAHKRIVMSVGVFTGRKNMPKFLDAFASIPRSTRQDVIVVLTGNRPKNKPYPQILEAIRRNTLENDVHIVMNLPQGDLVALYNLATVLVFPSLAEGFGLPVLEAMQCGCPVITSNCSSLPEVSGDAAMYCDPYDCESMASTLARLLGDETLRRTLVEKGYARAAQFSWEKTASTTRNVYRTALTV